MSTGGKIPPTSDQLLASIVGSGFAELNFRAAPGHEYLIDCEILDEKDGMPVRVTATGWVPPDYDADDFRGLLDTKVQLSGGRAAFVIRPKLLLDTTVQLGMPKSFVGELTGCEITPIVKAS